MVLLPKGHPHRHPLGFWKPAGSTRQHGVQHSLQPIQSALDCLVICLPARLPGCCRSWCSVAA
jgi:hypothetical protein